MPTAALPPKPDNEDARLAALREYEILDTDPEVGFDDLTLLASTICGAPISAVTLVDADRQWFKSRVGIEASETPLERSFCAYAILRPQQTLVVEDAVQDEVFAEHAAVAGEGGIRFYAGAPLVTPEGFALGTICVADTVPHHPSPEQIRALEALARQVQTQLELRRKLRDLRHETARRQRAEAEKDARTAEIERDLQFARQFQQSLLPDTARYPVGSESPTAGVRLSFHHVYQPALSLGGDFFDVVKLSDTRAGVFIADVMGHGARSALVTAIVRTLFQEMAPQAEGPADLLTRLNARFHPIVAGSDQFLFVSAGYLVLDTERSQAIYASAGHPAPIRADSDRRRVGPLQDACCTSAALGLAGDTQYQECRFDISPGDTFLLFTDGLTEAPRAGEEAERGGMDEEFGDERLLAAIRRTPEADAGRLSQAIMDALHEWTGGTPLPDDLCLVVAEAVCDPR